MTKIRMCYEDTDDDQLVPVRMVIRFEKGRFKWNAHRLPILVDAPFERILLRDLEDDVISMTVSLAELTRDSNHPDRFYLHIPLLIERLEKMKAKGEIPENFDYREIQQFMIFMGDVVEVMHMDVRPYYVW